MSDTLLSVSVNNFEAWLSLISFTKAEKLFLVRWFICKKKKRQTATAGASRAAQMYYEEAPQASQGLKWCEA